MPVDGRLATVTGETTGKSTGGYVRSQSRGAGQSRSCSVQLQRLALCSHVRKVSGARVLGPEAGRLPGTPPCLQPQLLDPHPLLPGGLGVDRPGVDRHRAILVRELGLGVVPPLVVLEPGEGGEDQLAAREQTLGPEGPVGLCVIPQLRGGLETQAAA